MKKTQLNIHFESIFSIIQNYPLENTLFYEFCEKSTQQEFLQQQTPFFHAVQAFPQLLCALGQYVPHSSARKSVIDNLFEEHCNNQGIKQFHTHTFCEYLSALDNQDVSVINLLEKLQQEKHHLAVEHWFYYVKNAINGKENNKNDEQVLQSNIYGVKNLTQGLELALKLCAIELIYTRISHKIIQKIDTFNLKHQQNHYTVHEVLDVHHGQDLWHIAEYFLNLLPDEELKFYDENRIKNIINESIEQFVLMLNQLCFITEQHRQEMSAEKIAFYYSREDAIIEINALKSIANTSIENNPRILIICSGGETVAQIKSNYPNSAITAFDINIHQLELAKFKLENAKNDSVPIFKTGKFERFFHFLSQQILTCSEMNLSTENAINTQIIKNKDFSPFYELLMQELIQNVFTEQNLEAVFTEEATKYSKNNPKTFGEHFSELLIQQFHKCRNNQSQENNNTDIIDNIDNILCVLQQKARLMPCLKPNEIQEINFFHGTFEEVIQNFDLISLSNIGDWLPLLDFQQKVQLSWKYLNNGGMLICRKLLGDYDLQKELESIFGHENIQVVHDNTDFYSTTIIATKR